MDMKNIILSKKDSFLIEEAIVRYGRVVAFKQLYAILKQNHSLAESRNRVSRLSSLGWLVRIKRGLYVVVSDIGSLAAEDISSYAIAQALNRDAYISFESALQFHGMFDQMLSTVGAVTFERARRYKVKNTEFRFFKIKKSLYFGFAKEKIDTGLVKIAHREKALLDILYFRSNAYYAGLVWESLKDYKSSIDFSLFKKYAAKSSFDVIRQAGFFLDRLGIETKDLLRIVHGKKSYSKMTRDSKDFDAKWRLYFERSTVD